MEMIWLSKEWATFDLLLTHVAVGHAGVWAVHDSNVYYREDTYGDYRSGGSRFLPIEGKMKQLDVGKDVVWAVNTEGKVFVRHEISQQKPEGRDWMEIAGSPKMRQVTVNNSGQVWAVDDEYKVYRRTGASNSNHQGDSWEEKPGVNFEQVVADEWNVWARTKADDIVVKSIDGAEDWRSVGCKSVQHLSANNTTVFGARPDDQVNYLTHWCPDGEWLPLKNASQVSKMDVWCTAMWAIDTSGYVKARLLQI